MREFREFFLSAEFRRRLPGWSFLRVNLGSISEILLCRGYVPGCGDNKSSLPELNHVQDRNTVYKMSSLDCSDGLVRTRDQFQCPFPHLSEQAGSENRLSHIQFLLWS